VRRVIAAIALLTIPATAGAAASLRDAAMVPAPVNTPAMQANLSDGNASEPISPTKAVLYSLLLPGLGDYKLGNHGRAAAFFAVEGAIWISYGVFSAQGSAREEDYQELAVRFAGVDRTGHSDDYYALLREYDSSDVYETDLKDEGRFELREVLNGAQMEDYFIENRIDDYAPWQWDTYEHRLQYSEVRSSSKTAYRRADYMFAAAAANRVVSAIVAYAAARGMQKSADEVGYGVEFAPARDGVDVRVSLTRSF
jgi:hypothetical protein